MVGRTARLNGRPYTIIGVTPSAFTGTDGLIRAAGYVPLWMLDDLMNTAGVSILERRDAHAFTVLGRLKPGVSPAQARAALAITSSALARQYPSTNKDVSLLVVPETHARPNPGIGPFFRVIALAMAGLAVLLLLITSANVVNLLSPEGQVRSPDGQTPEAFDARVSPEYFATARVPLIESRAFDARDDANAAPVAIVNQTLARQFWPGQSAIGRRLEIGDERLNVVGVARDGKYNFVWETPSRMVFRPLAQGVPASSTIVVRTTRPPSEMASAVQQAMRSADPDVAIYDVRTMRDHLNNGNAFNMFRLGATVTGLFGGMGVLLASIGLYGMIAYHVSQRTQEIGVRMALGARADDIVRDVLARAGRLVLAGTVIGLVLAAGLAQLLRTFLLDISPFDPLTYAAVASLLITISLLAAFVPARRATVVDPVVALRAE